MRRILAAFLAAAGLLPVLAGEAVEQFKQEIVYDNPDMSPIILRGESRSENARAALYAVGCDVYFTDGTLHWHFVRDFPNGTHDWVEASGLYVPKKPVRRVVVYAALKRGTGKAQFRNCRVERRWPTPEERFGVRRRTLAPFENADELHYETYDPKRGWQRRTERVPAKIAVKSPLRVDELRVWTADPFRRITPLTFPAAADGKPSVSLLLARRETENAQVLVSAGDNAGADGLRLELPAPRSKDGVAFKGSLAWKRQGYLKRTQVFRQMPDSQPSYESWIPDPLLPPAPFSVPAGGTVGLWLEARTDADCPPGLYRCEARVLESGRAIAEFPVELDVREATLPERFSFTTLFTTFDGYLRKVYGKGWERMRRPMMDVMLDHRLNPVDSSRFLPPDPADVLYAHSRGANACCLLNIVPEPANSNAIWVCYAPVKVLESPGFYESVRRRVDPVWKALRNTPAAKDLFFYGFDERGKEFYPVMDRFWRQLQMDYPGVPLKTSSKTYRDLGKGERGNLLYSSDWFGPRIDVWKPSLTEDLKSRGKKVGFYVSEDPLPPWPGVGSYEFHRADARILFWMSYRENADFLSYWATDYWNYKCGRLDERKTFFPDFDTWNTSRMSGDGILIYPGKDTVLPSIHLAQLRDGEEDFELLAAYGKKHGREAALHHVGRLVRGLTDFSRDAADFRAVRESLMSERGAYPFRWFRLNCDFRKAEDLAFAESIVRRAAATGVYNGVLLEPPAARAIETCGSWSEQEVAAFRKFQRLCESLGIEIVPVIWSPGYGFALSVHPDLAAALPVKDVRFRRKGAKGVFEPSREAVRDFGRLGGPYEFDIAGTNGGLNRDFHPFKASPFKMYRCRYRAKTEGLNPDHRFQILFYGRKSGDFDVPLRGIYPSRGKNSDWFNAHFDFHGGDTEEHHLGIGVWSFRSGKARIERISLEEIAPTTFLHREGTPITIRNAVTGAIYKEGRDVVFSPSRSPWTPEGRRSVEVSFPPGSMVPDGGCISVDGYAPAVIGWDQYPACLTSPELAGHFARSARDIEKLFGRFPRRVLLSDDETRAGGTCETCQRSGMDMPHAYANMVKAQRAAVRAVSPETEMLIWSDMMDPYHNARRERYFLCKGGYEGTRELIPRDLTVACWLRRETEDSVRGFADAGFVTCAATYYDSGSLASSRRWLRAGNATPGFKGLIYATWRSGAKQDFRFLEDFAEMLKHESSPLGKKDVK